MGFPVILPRKGNADVLEEVEHELPENVVVLDFGGDYEGNRDKHRDVFFVLLLLYFFD